jgi:hypothetical protein
LPAPGDAAERTTDIQVGGPNVALDHLGPVVVRSCADAPSTSADLLSLTPHLHPRRSTSMV